MAIVVQTYRGHIQLAWSKGQRKKLVKKVEHERINLGSKARVKVKIFSEGQTLNRKKTYVKILKNKP